MRQGSRTLLHLINVTGQSQTGYFTPVPMDAIHVRVAGHFTAARTVRLPHSLPVTFAGGYSEFTVPHLADYELVVLQ